MVKRISCRVVSSVPLTKNNSVSLRADQSNNKQHKTSDAIAIKTGLGHTSNSDKMPKAHNSTWETYIYTNRLDTAKTAVDNIPIGQILNSYA